MRFLRTYARVIGLLGRDLRIAGFLAFANLIVAGLQFLDPVLFGRVVNLLSESDKLGRSELWHQGAILLGIWVAVGIGGILGNISVSLQTERLAHRHRIKSMGRYFQHVLALPLSFHGDTHSGRLIKAMLSGTDGLFGTWLVFFRDQLSTILSAAVLLPLTLFLNWRLAIVLIALVAVFLVFTAIVVQKTETAQRQVEGLNSSLAGTAQDALTNVMVVQSFTRLSAEGKLFSDIAAQLIRHQFPVLNWWALVNVMTRASSTIAVITIVLVGTWLHVNGLASVGEIVSFMGFAMLLIGRLETAASFVSSLFFKLPALEDFFRILDARSNVPEKENARTLWAPRGEVKFEAVSFAYPNTGATVLSDLTFTAKPGTSVAVVGHTGAGKSTAMSLLQRLWDPTQGRITVDGQDLRDVTLDSLRSNIGVVFQESLLFNRTIRDNLLVGRPNATDEEIEQACRMADAHEFIVRQPHGYDTMIGERGTTLSGGQRQRLAIARALLKNPPILILDEATSALDAATEARVSKALKTLMAGRTTFIIAHRLSTVKDADEILVFDDGRIVEQGNFQGLLAKDGRFAELVQTQLATSVPQLAAAE
ncbi:MAG TPA: glucan ABC transporter ATP-binding protein/ permease [Rhodopila sp.]|uniref:glucan ABC transporter ATP-binding protein/ permease n=1 Tax=Rhodopila sp. TaxID=2480087 RepID=UPI002B6FAB7C|nr:glucan ABC transporter ATP-binding protein/ permease [Rhodopila sp.]HVY14952.1 glucan ABC transporter ATP-binding protein/ permease [Rhodopila sp.]